VLAAPPRRRIVDRPRTASTGLAPLHQVRTPNGTVQVTNSTIRPAAGGSQGAGVRATPPITPTAIVTAGPALTASNNSNPPSTPTSTCNQVLVRRCSPVERIDGRHRSGWIGEYFPSVGGELR